MDSTFIRSIKQKLFDMNAEDAFSERLKNSGDLNLALSGLLLFKYGTMFEPSAELKQVEDDHGVDAWFELMKRHQQYALPPSTVCCASIVVKQPSAAADNPKPGQLPKPSFKSKSSD